MKKEKILFMLLAGLIVISLIFPFETKAQTSAYEKISKIIHDESWYAGCPKCRDLFDAAFAEVQKGSSEWEKLVKFYSGCLMEEHREIESINFLLEVLKTSPDNQAFLAGIGTCYLRMQDFENAEKYFFQSNTVKPNRDAYYKLAFIHYVWGVGISDENEMEKRKELLAKAEEEIKKTIELYEAHGTEKHVSRYSSSANLSMLANIYKGQGKADQAESIYRKIISEVESSRGWNPKRRNFALAEFYFSLGQLLLRKDEKEEGVKLMNKAIEIAPTENLKSIKRLLLDLTLNPPEKKEDLKARYPQMREGVCIPLY